MSFWPSNILVNIRNYSEVMRYQSVYTSALISMAIYCSWFKKIQHQQPLTFALTTVTKKGNWIPLVFVGCHLWHITSINVFFLPNITDFVPCCLKTKTMKSEHIIIFWLISIFNHLTLISVVHICTIAHCSTQSCDSIFTVTPALLFIFNILHGWKYELEPWLGEVAGDGL